MKRIKVDSAGIISSFKRIYRDFSVPKNLQEHMVRVAAVGELICDNWVSEGVHRNDIVAASLVHDMSNIVKFDFNTAPQNKLLSQSGHSVEFWRAKQRDVIRKYGSDADESTAKMLKELNVDGRLLFIVSKIGIRSAEFVEKSDDWDTKVCYYADKRVGPFGVISLKERFEEGRERYKNHISTLNEKEIRSSEDLSFIIEKQVMSRTKLRPFDINDSNISGYLKGYLPKKI